MREYGNDRPLLLRLPALAQEGGRGMNCKECGWPIEECQCLTEEEQIDMWGKVLYPPKKIKAKETEPRR